VLLLARIGVDCVLLPVTSLQLLPVAICQSLDQFVVLNGVASLICAGLLLLFLREFASVGARIRRC